MGVKIRKIRGKWYLVIDYKGRRKTKAISTKKEVADEVRRKVEAKLALGDLGIFEESECQTPSFVEYSEQWLRDHGPSIKPSTKRSYEQILRVHVTPRLGTKKISDITRQDVKDFIAFLSIDDTRSRNTVRLIVTTLRAVLNAAVEDNLIEANPASKIGKFNKKERGESKAQAMTAAEAQHFLEACQEVCPEYFVFFFAALRSGLRRGELIALKWGDIQFGESENSRDRFILVQRNYYMGQFGTPKNHDYRRVDMSKQLRAVLLEHKQAALLRAFQLGKTSIAEDLVFPSEAGTPISADNIVPRYMEPALERAGLRRFRFHDLRHTFGSLLIQAGVSPAYVQKQMGHKSIQVTIDVYGHLIPGDNVSWIDALDRGRSHGMSTSANQAQTPNLLEKEALLSGSKDWLPPRDSNPDMLIQSQLSCR